MYTGFCVLDALRFQAALEEEEVGHPSFVLSKSSPTVSLTLAVVAATKN
jgi:hypothetical protein